MVTHLFLSRNNSVHIILFNLKKGKILGWKKMIFYILSGKQIVTAQTTTVRTRAGKGVERLRCCCRKYLSWNLKWWEKFMGGKFGSFNLFVSWRMRFSANRSFCSEGKKASRTSFLRCFKDCWVEKTLTSNSLADASKSKPMEILFSHW